MPIISNIGKSAIGAAIGRQSMGKGLVRAGAGIIATRIATRSIPGAMLVGGAFLAKMLYDQRKARKRPAAKDMIIDQ